MIEKLLGKGEFSVRLEKLPYVDYTTLWGVNDERIDLAIYAYLP